MTRLAANLSMMFNEWPFLERFGKAKEAGFTAVEYLFPYEHPAEEIGAALQDNGLTQALFNLPPGDWAAGDRGIAAMPALATDLDVALRPVLLEGLEQHVSDLRVYRIEGAGHWVTRRNAVEVNRVIRRFLAGTPGPT